MTDSQIFILIIIFVSLAYIVAFEYVYLYKKKKYEETSYFNITKIPYSQIKHDSGHQGEYFIYNTLKNLESEGAKFLFNLYIPAYNNKTTEIDAVMIIQQGIFVFESKNYGGWIFGTENQKKWTQSFHIGYGKTQKEYFYNPIMQNEYHIKYLKKILDKDLKFFSIVVFSDDCEFKSIKRNEESKTILIHCCELKEAVTNLQLANADILSLANMEEIYNILYPYSQVSEETKMQHIANLKFNK